MPVSTPKYKNLFCQTLKKQVLIRGFLLYLIHFNQFSGTEQSTNFSHVSPTSSGMYRWSQNVRQLLFAQTFQLKNISYNLELKTIHSFDTCKTFST